jgi:hypothetical protein
VIPERVFPEPVSPVISQPRQKSSRVHDKPLSFTMGRIFGRFEKNTTQANATKAPEKIHESGLESVMKKYAAAASDRTNVMELSVFIWSENKLSNEQAGDQGAYRDENRREVWEQP